MDTFWGIVFELSCIAFVIWIITKICTFFRKSREQNEAYKENYTLPQRDDSGSPTLSKNDYGRIIVSHIVLMQGENFKEQAKKRGKWEFTDYLTYLLYLVFLSSKILENQYPPSDTDQIIDSCISGIVDGLDIIAPSKKSSLEELVKGQYHTLVDYAEMDIRSEDGLHELVNMLLEDIGCENDFQLHFSFYTEFALYITHHTSSILNDKIKVL